MEKDDIIDDYDPNQEYPSYFHRTNIEQMMDRWSLAVLMNYIEQLNHNDTDGHVHAEKFRQFILQLPK